MHLFADGRNEARGLAVMSGLTSAAGVLLLAFRCSRAKLGDGPIEFMPVLISGLVGLAAPFAVAVYRAARRTKRLTVPVGFISMAFAVAIAAMQPGNLMLLGFPVVLVPAIGLVWLAQALRRWLAKPRSA